MGSQLSKTTLLESILDLVYHNVFCSDHNNKKWAQTAERGFKNRILGFRAEVEFERKISGFSEIKSFSGPVLLPNKPVGDPLKSPVIFTVDKKAPIQYESLFERYLNISPNLFYIQYNEFSSVADYEMLDVFRDGYLIPVPNFECYRFTEEDKFTDVTSKDNHGLSLLIDMFNASNNPYIGRYRVSKTTKRFVKGILEKFTNSELNHILAVRMVFDGILGFGVKRGRPTDIDCIIETDRGFTAFEIKEKDLSKTPPKGFGMDISRAYDMLSLQNKLGMQFYYVVKQVNNQNERRHIAWRKISLNKFIQYSKNSKVSGGLGMMTAKQDFVKTMIVPESKYDSF